MFKRIPKGGWLILMVMAAAAALAGRAIAATAPGSTDHQQRKNMSMKTLNTNAWNISTTNYGPFVKPAAGGSGGFWHDPANGYIYGSGLWIGATDAQGNKIVAVGYNPNSGQSEFSPVDKNFEYSQYLNDANLKVYLSTDLNDVAIWPVRDSSNRKTIKSRQDSYARYGDNNPAFTTSGDKQLKVMVEQQSYAWNYSDNNDIVFFYFKIHNKSGKALKNVYIGPANDCDIGNESGANANDLTIFDYQRNLGIQFQNVNEPGWDLTGAVGFRYFESPMNNTGSPVVVTDNQYTHTVYSWGTINADIRLYINNKYGETESLRDSTYLVNTYGKELYALGMTAFKIFTIAQDPKTDEERYLEMQGINYWDMNKDAYDEWGAAEPGDKRFLMASGPFKLGIDSMITTCLGILGASDTAKLKLVSDVAQTIYDNNFELAVPPTPPKVTVTSGDKCAIISWNRQAETTPDPYFEKLDPNKKWFEYKKGSWQWLPPASRLKVDSFEIKIQDPSNPGVKSSKIARGAPPQAIGRDTLMAFYSDKSLYEQFDFQGYVVYRARNMTDMADPAKREYVGAAYTDTISKFDSINKSYGGATSYCYDKIDGVKIMLGINPVNYQTPGGVIELVKYDTLGTDRGLVYSLTDSNVVNGFGYYYGVSAYDHQTNVYFTRKCPRSLATNPTENAVYGVARKPMVDFQPPTLNVSVTGLSSLKDGGTVDYNYKSVLIPKDIKNDTFRLAWKAMRFTQIPGSTRRTPVFPFELRDKIAVLDTIADSTVVVDSIINAAELSTLYSASETACTGKLPNELSFGGVVMNVSYFCTDDSSIIKVDTVEVTGSYPKDSIYAKLNSAYSWMWRGSDFEIRWRDTLVLGSTALTATVWDVSNGIEVPLQLLPKTNMTTSAWAFDVRPTASVAYIDSAGVANRGMFIAGIQIWLNKRNNGSLKAMVWSQRPHTGDVWTVRCSGPCTPQEGAVATIITTKASRVANLTADLLNNVKVVPNPYLVRANWDVSKNYPNIIFVNLPSKCTIRIYNLGGDLVRVLNHESSFDDNNGTEKWNLLSTYDKRPASGVFIYQVDAPGIGTKLGKFAVIK